MKLFVLFSLVSWLCISSANVLAAKKQKPTSVADLRYGVSLYHYFQKSYLDALTELMVAEARGGIKGHGDWPEIMKGGFLLAYGMERHASEIFDRVLEQNSTKGGRAAAWFYLAKMRYLRGDYLGAQDAIDKMPLGSYRKIIDDVRALSINVAIQRSDLDLAEKLLRDETLGGGWSPYLYYNLGSAWARVSEFDKAISHFNYLGKQEFKSAEHRALYDKAMTAAGYSYLLAGRYGEAINQFSRVRLTSHLSGRALLGYGWAAAEKQDYKEALKAWNHLSLQSLVDENSQESLIAVPYAYEKLGSEGLALQHFQRAEQSFLDEIAKVDTVIANIQSDQMLMALNISSSEGIDWMRYAAKNQLSPQLSYLVSLFAREEFQGIVQELRDLLAVQANTQSWNNKLSFYIDMLNDRERNRNMKTAELAEEKMRGIIDTMSKKRAALVRRIESIATSKDYFALASPEETDLIKRVLRDKKHIELLRNSDPFIDESEDAVRRYHGILLWNAQEQFSDRLWQLVKTLNSLDDSLKEMRINYASVLKILNEAPDMSGYRGKINRAQQVLFVQQQKVDQAVVNTQNALREQVIGVLQQQRERLQVYLSQSRLSIARLYDKSSIDAQKIQQAPAEVTAEAAVLGSQPPNTDIEGGK